MSHSTHVDSPYLTADEAAEYLRYPSTHWFRVSARKYGIRCVRRGRRVFFTKADLDQFMAKGGEKKPSLKRRAKAS